MATSKDGLFKRGRVFWTWFRGERVSCRTRDRKAALLYKAKLERAGADPAYLAANEATVGGALKDFYVHFATRDRSHHTLVMHRRNGGHLARLLGDATRLADVNAKEIDGYIAARLAEGSARVTLGKELTTARQALRLAKRHGAYPFDLDQVMPMAFSTEYKPKERALDLGEIMTLIASVEAFSPLHARMVAFIVATAARKSEAESALPGDIDWANRIVKIRGTKTQEAAADVPILKQFEGLLHYAQPARFGVWQNMSRDMDAACVRAGIPKVTANDLRRTTATLLRRAGASSDMIARMLRHADSRMVERVYGRVRAEDAGRVLAIQIQHSAWGADEKTGCPGPESNWRHEDFQAEVSPGAGADLGDYSGEPQEDAEHVAPPINHEAYRNSTESKYFRLASWAWFRRAA